MGLENIRPKREKFFIAGKEREFKLRHKGLAYISEKYGTYQKGIEKLFNTEIDKEVTKEEWEALVDFTYACCIDDPELTREMVDDDIDVPTRRLVIRPVLTALGYHFPEVKENFQEGQ